MADAGSDSPHLEPEEQQRAADNAPLAARVVHEIIRKEGQDELERDGGSLVWSGLAAGLSMGFSFYVEAHLRAGLPDTAWRGLIEGFGYTIGFVIVVLGRQQLFTESTLSAVLPVLTQRDLPTVRRCLRLWAWVLVANLAGTWMFAAMLAFGRPFEPQVGPALASLAAQTLEGSFWSTALKAVLAGWLIALMVWLLPSSRSARLFIIVLITYVVALGKLAHVIAGSSEAAFAVLSGAASLADYFGRFLAPTLIGNTIGGVILVALLNHAPIAPELEGGSGEGAEGKDA